MFKQDYSIGVLMLSYNDESILEDCLMSIRNQNYDQSLINIFLMDGGSSDGTLRIAQKYGATIISHPELKNQPDIRTAIGFQASRADLVIFFSADNRFQEKDALSEMVKTFDDQEVVACETLRYGYRKTDPALSRYFALIGGCDPIAVGLGKADRGPYDKNGSWHSFGVALDCGEYFKVKFESDVSKIPTIGANGFLIRRELIDEMDYKENGAHIDMCVSLIKKGYSSFAFVKNKHVVHYINISIIAFLKRRLLWAKVYSADKIKREYGVFQKKDTVRLILMVFANLTFILPLLRAIKGYFFVRDIAWFLHPLVCFVFTLSYGLFYFKKYFSNNV
ncbi:MAG: glycosyltransferase [Patescibacteria group bacterium]|jgi:glycosyltransferase involved in cell wall biosynthesis